jgi:hypothetical protein
MFFCRGSSCGQRNCLLWAAKEEIKPSTRCNMQPKLLLSTFHEGFSLQSATCYQQDHAYGFFDPRPKGRIIRQQVVGNKSLAKAENNRKSSAYLSQSQFRPQSTSSTSMFQGSFQYGVEEDGPRLGHYLVYLQTLLQTFEEIGADGKRIPLLGDLPSVCSTGFLCKRGEEHQHWMQNCKRATALRQFEQATTV